MNKEIRFVQQIGPAYSSNNAGDGPEKTRDHRFWFPRFKSNWLGTFRSKRMFPCCECALAARATVSNRYRGSDQKHCTCGGDQWHCAKQIEEDEHDRRAEVSKYFNSARYDDVVAHLRMHTKLKDHEIESLRVNDCAQMKLPRTVNPNILQNNNALDFMQSVSSTSPCRFLERRRSDSSLLRPSRGKRIRNENMDGIDGALSVISRAGSFDQIDMQTNYHLYEGQRPHHLHCRNTDGDVWSLYSSTAIYPSSGKSTIHSEYERSVEMDMRETISKEMDKHSGYCFDENSQSMVRLDRTNSDEHSVIEDFITTLLKEPEIEHLLSQSPRNAASSHTNSSGVKHSLSNTSAAAITTGNLGVAPSIRQTAQSIDYFIQSFYRCSSTS